MTMNDAPRVTVPVEPTEEVRDAVAWLEKAFPKDAVGFSTSYRPTMTAVHTVISALSAAPAPEGGAVDDEALKIATELHTAFEKLIYGLPKYLDAENLTDEENMIREAWITLDVTAHRLAALATREEAPAEAGADEEIFSQGHNFIATCKECGVAFDAHLRGCSNVRPTALRAQPPAREDAQPVDATWHYTKDCPAPDALRVVTPELAAEFVNIDGPWTRGQMEMEEVWSRLIDAQLAALQAEQKGGA